MRPAWTLAAGALLMAVGCGSREAPATPQVVLWIDTDAPVPSATNPPLGVDDPLPLFDSVRVDVYPPGADAPCATCSNDFDLTIERLRDGASIGIVPPAGVAGTRARVRMYRRVFVTTGEPRAQATVDVTVSLPAVSGNDVVDVTVMLPTDSVGAPVGTPSSPVAPTPGRPSATHAGTWAPAQRVDCTGAPHANEVCVPGGAFWMGNPRSLDVGANDQGTHPRLVVLSPFFMKKTEVTVAEFRGTGDAPDIMFSGSLNDTAREDWCTYSVNVQPYCNATPCDGDPLNCVRWDEARAWCQARGGDLPSEAQYEYVATALHSQRFVWGEDEPSCSDAVYGIDGDGLLGNFEAACPPDFYHGGVHVVGTGARDRLKLASGTIVDIAGNLSEWALDTWNRDDEPCWSQAGVLTDPVCRTKSAADGDGHTVRGGNWLADSVSLRASSRSIAQGSLKGATDIDTGFRCVRRDSGP